ncbi:MAG: tRNA lysidine(34) synthetase TilS [Deltaproteobacteria bacterium]|nr:tRNA lysidine(34) synthetase TilS [Deltaproteobacteria bacterium]
MNSDSKILGSVERAIAGHGMISRGDGVVVGLSGGPDSVCLLHVLYRLSALLGIRLVAAHFDHGLRPAEDENETRFTTDLAQSLNLPVDSGKWASVQISVKGSMEERARDARYLFLEAVKRKFGCRRIALGHTLDDQAETVLMRLLRGSGPAGLSGIPPCREGGIIRPLIDIRRSDVEAYLARNGLSYVTDSSNSERHILRNRIRLDLLPVLKDYQPKIIEHLARTARIMRDDEGWMEGVAAEWLSETAETGENGDIRIPVAAFNRLHRALKSRVIRLAMKKTAGTLRRVDAGHVEAVGRLADSRRPQARLDLPNNLTARRVYEHLVIAPFHEAVVHEFSYTIDGPGTCRVEAIQRSITLTFDHAETPTRNGNTPSTALLNGDRITFPLTVRNFRPGDRFVPLGMAGHKKVKDFFIDLKLPAPDRHRVPILLQGEDIMWICGYRIDDRFKVTPDTRRVLRVTLD